MNSDIILIYRLIAETLEAKLEEDLTSYNFEIAVKVGSVQYQPKQGKIRAKNKPLINGVIIARPTELVPVKDYDSYELDCVFNLAVSPTIANSVFEEVLSIAKAYSGEILEIRDDQEVLTTSVLLTFNTPYMNAPDIKPGAGTTVDIKTAISALVFGNAVASNNIHFEICVDPSAATPTYERLTVLTGAVSKVSTQELQNVTNDEQAVAINLSQTVTANASVIYQNTTALKQIVTDMFSGGLDKTYKMKYYDGVAILSTSPIIFDVLTSQVSLNFAAGTIATIEFNITRA